MDTNIPHSAEWISLRVCVCGLWPGAPTVSCTCRRTNSSSTSTAWLDHAIIIRTPPTSTRGDVTCHWTTSTLPRTWCTSGRTSRPCSTEEVASVWRRRCLRVARPMWRCQKELIEERVSVLGGRSGSEWSRTWDEPEELQQRPSRTGHPTVSNDRTDYISSRRILYFGDLELVLLRPVNITHTVVQHRHQSSPVSLTMTSSWCRCSLLQLHPVTCGRHVPRSAEYIRSRRPSGPRTFPLPNFCLSLVVREIRRSSYWRCRRAVWVNTIASWTTSEHYWRLTRTWNSLVMSFTDQVTHRCRHTSHSQRSVSSPTSTILPSSVRDPRCHHKSIMTTKPSMQWTTAISTTSKNKWTTAVIVVTATDTLTTISWTRTRLAVSQTLILDIPTRYWLSQFTSTSCYHLHLRQIYCSRSLSFVIHSFIVMSSRLLKKLLMVFTIFSLIFVTLYSTALHYMLSQRFELSK